MELFKFLKKKNLYCVFIVKFDPVLAEQWSARTLTVCNTNKQTTGSQSPAGRFSSMILSERGGLVVLDFLTLSYGGVWVGRLVKSDRFFLS